MLVAGSSQGADMVELSAPCQLFFANSEARSIDSNNIGCIHPRVGGSLSRCDNWRSVDNERDPMPHQYARTQGSLLSDSILFEETDSSECVSQVGQPDSDCISEPDEEPLSDPSLPTCYSDMGLVSGPSNSITGRISPRHREHNSRLGIKTSPGQKRLVIVPISVRHTESPAGSILNRSFCLQNEPPLTYILQLETGPECS